MPSASDLDRLRAAIAGDVVTPGAPGWDTARQAWNLTVDQRPALVVLADTPDDVAATVRFARANDLRVAPQSTGHGAPSLGDLAGTILLRTSRLSGVSVDPDARLARVQAGARWNEVILPAGEHGLVALHGMSGGVGVAGYTLGGGLGWLARREGFASSHVRSFDVVTADGERRHVNAESEPDLFWALRGGGGGPAIVTSLEIGLFPSRTAFAGSLVWTIELAPEIVHAYRAWITAVPDTITSTIKLVRYPPVPEVPEPLRGRALTVVTLAFTGGDAEGNALTAPLRATAPPYLDTLATVPAPALAGISGDPLDPSPGIGNSLLLSTFTADAAAAFVDLAGPQADTPLTSLEIRQLGGALRTPTTDLGAAGTVDAEALLYGVGSRVTPEVGAVIETTLDTVSERLAPWADGRGTLLTFDERGRGLRGSFAPDVADRLAGISAHYDPDARLVANHAVD